MRGLCADMRYLFYTPSDGMGLGHIRRNLAVTAAVVGLDPAGSVLFVHGTDEGDRLGVPPRVTLLRLPAVRRSGDRSYATRRSAVPPAEVLALRSAVLRAAVESYQPDVLLVDKRPMGAKGDVISALEAQSRRGGRTVLGLRDILDNGARVRRS